MNDPAVFARNRHKYSVTPGGMPWRSPTPEGERDKEHLLRIRTASSPPKTQTAFAKRKRSPSPTFAPGEPRTEREWLEQCRQLRIKKEEERELARERIRLMIARDIATRKKKEQRCD